MLSFIMKNKEEINNYIDEISENENIEPILRDAITYSLKDGKAIRATLLIETIKGLNIKLIDRSVYRSALAVEMIHAYSLIHDDLPAIDNDNYRRGKLTLHKKFGEDVAIVSGDALGGFAFKYLATTNYNSDTKIEMIKELADAAGPEGMVYGQIMDMRYPINSIEELNKMHFLKTGKMILLPIKLALIIANIKKDSPAYNDFLNYGKNIGIAFQARDDLLDVIGDENKVGKKLKKDSLQNKKTYIDFWGIEGTQKKIDELLDSAINSIKKYNLKSLESIANFLRKRDY